MDFLSFQLIITLAHSNSDFLLTKKNTKKNTNNDIGIPLPYSKVIRFYTLPKAHIEHS